LSAGRYKSQKVRKTYLKNNIICAHHGIIFRIMKLKRNVLLDGYITLVGEVGDTLNIFRNNHETSWKLFHRKDSANEFVGK
jgi:hypothetical protein